MQQILETDQNESAERKLKPVVFSRGSYGNYYADDEWRQRLLLKAITITDKPDEWRKMIGVKTMAELYRTLDKLSMRKSYHKALSEEGIDFPFIIRGIKESCSSEKEDIKLKAYQTLLKSLGMDKYDDVSAEGGQNWEELLQAATEKEQENKTIIEKEKIIDIDAAYDVEQPHIPEFIVQKQAEEKVVGRTLYE